MHFKLDESTPLLKMFILYMVVCTITIGAMSLLSKGLYELSYSWISCGEALNRANGSAAPRSRIEEHMFNECLFLGVKRWDQ